MSYIVVLPQYNNILTNHAVAELTSKYVAVCLGV